MNLSLLDSLVDRYLRMRANDLEIQDQRATHQVRKTRAAMLLTPAHIPVLTREEWVEFLRDTDAALGNPWDSRTFWNKYYGDAEELPIVLRENLLQIIGQAERGLTAQEFNEAIAVLPHIGPAYLSEILALRFPDRYWLYNSKVRDVLGILGVDLKGELPWGKKGNEGELYLHAGAHISAIRDALKTREDDAGEETAVDFLEADRFIYWVTMREKPDIWRGEIEKIVREDMPAARIGARRDHEDAARRIVRDNLGALDERLARELFGHLSADAQEGRELGNRFMPALYGHLVNTMVADMATLNRWIRRLWEADDNGLEEALEEFWRADAVPGAGISMPTAILYLRDPEHYAVWLPTLSQALQIVTGFTPGVSGSVGGYRSYNEAAQRFRERYALPPQALDLVLWRIARDGGIVTVAPDPITPPAVPEPTPYTLDDLRADTFLDEHFWSSAKALVVDKRQIILYGPPGTGKTWVAKKFARHWVGTASDPRGEVRVVQFHPSYSYEEFVEGIRPASVERPGGGRDISYEVRDGIFKSFCREAAAHPARSFVLILDEINRGELPRIFGELLYLLEYRGESVLLPYSGEEFSVPDNLYVIGTMNSADRSIALVDHALRRRFHFIDMRPDPDALRSFHEKHGNTTMVWTAALLESVNRQLEEDGVEWHLHIGHSHLMSAALDEGRLRMIWEHSILPTLAEYFHRRTDGLGAYTLDTIRASLGVGRP